MFEKEVFSRYPKRHSRYQNSLTPKQVRFIAEASALQLTPGPLHGTASFVLDAYYCCRCTLPLSRVTILGTAYRDQSLVVNWPLTFQLYLL